VTATIDIDGMSRDEWLDVRRQGIGSSDAPAICGLDRFRSPFVVYLDKRGELDEEPENPAMEWGRRLEDPIAAKFADDTGLEVAKPTVMYRHPEHPFMLCSPDRLVGDVALLEIKTSALRHDWRDGPPERVLVQGQHQLLVTGRERVHFACLLDGRYYDTWTFERDEDTIALLVEIETRFWQRVLDGDPPPVDGHQSTTTALAQLYAFSERDLEVDLPDDARRLVEELRLAKQMATDAKADVDLVQNELKALLGNAEIGLLDGEQVVTWKAGKQRDHLHNCPDCEHPAGPPSRAFLLKGAR